MVRRAWINSVAGLALLGGAGCHLGPQPRAIKAEPPVVRTDPVATRFVAMHNRNAAAITSLEAHPSVRVTASGEGGGSGRVSGDLALERDRNLCLELRVVGKGSVANIGSNPDEFWFWIDGDKDKSLYFCDHRDVNNSPLAITYQPDWIMEAMGLRPITAAEAKTMSVKAGIPGTLVITQSRRDGKGQNYTKETTVNEQTARIIEHKLYAGTTIDPAALLAVAKVKTYVEFDLLDNPAGDDGAGATGEPRKVYVPDVFRLEWVQEKFALDIQLSTRSSRQQPVINPKFSEQRRLALFAEPTISGVTRRDLAQMDVDQPGGAGTNPVPAVGAQVRESRPIPRAGGIQLGNPIPDQGGDSDGAVRTSIDPAPLSADLSSTPAQPAGIAGSTARTRSRKPWLAPGPSQ